MNSKIIAGIFSFSILVMLGCKPNASVRINKRASMSNISNLPDNPLEMNPMAVSLRPEQKTISTLYGNGIASRRLTGSANYAPGSVLYLVTWKEKADTEWFGARIPDQITAIERVAIDRNGQKNYTFYKSPACPAVFYSKKDERPSIILSMPIAVSPGLYQGSFKQLTLANTKRCVVNITAANNQ
ncbi:MAG: hypothetical protein EOO10_15765 [Chitinophagaceae bacterium]|nr:MAG: hypothetical protein EOO10_15765 [Chitinophagaceae bacterium]